jgi:putative SOS response-associated peptidase YedK
MCGRLIISKFPDDIAQWLGTTGSLPNSPPRYNVAPTDQVAVVRFNSETKQRTLGQSGARWRDGAEAARIMELMAHWFSIEE